MTECRVFRAAALDLNFHRMHVPLDVCRRCITIKSTGISMFFEYNMDAGEKVSRDALTAASDKAAGEEAAAAVEEAAPVLDADGNVIIAPVAITGTHTLPTL